MHSLEHYTSPEKGLFNVSMNYMYQFVKVMQLSVFLLFFLDSMSSLDMDLQEDVFDLMAEEYFSNEDGFNLDQEQSYAATMECPFADFNIRGTFLSKVKF